MAYLIGTSRKNPETGRMEPYFRIGERVAGRQVTQALGFVTRREADRLLRIYEGRRAAGEHVGLPQRPEPRLSSLGDWIALRLETTLDANGAAPKTRESAQCSARHLVRLLGSFTLAGITPADVEGYICTRRTEGVRSRTIQIELSWLRRLLMLAVEDGVLAQAPRVPRPPVTDARPHVFLTAAQASRLLDALPWATEPASCMAIYFGLDLGLRRGEILSRRWENVRWTQTAHGALYVGPQVVGDFVFHTKSRKARTVPLTPGLHEALRAWLGLQGEPEVGWIFPGRAGRPMANFKRTLATACEVAKVPVLHVHAMRHTWATAKAVAGVPRALTQQLGGWSSPEMLNEVYEHALSDLESEAMQRGAVEGKARLRLLPGAATHGASRHNTATGK